MENNSKNRTILKHNISFSPPDVGEQEAQEVTAALLSGWITTGKSEI